MDGTVSPFITSAQTLYFTLGWSVGTTISSPLWAKETIQKQMDATVSLWEDILKANIYCLYLKLKR
jgi:hypothetical protein